jgi:mutator protein MutT
VAEEDRKPHFHVTAGLICQDGRVLIARRPAGSHLAGFWEFPGGKQEQGESLGACLEREIREELGMEVRAGEHLLTVDYEYESRIITLHLFKCSRLDGEPRALECQEVKWVAPGELVRYTFPPPDQKIIRFIVSGEAK